MQDITDQIRKMKMAFERRFKASISVGSPMMQWFIEHVAIVINRRQMGHDDKTPHKPAHQREAPPSQFEFGEHVFARFAPKRPQAKRKVPLAPRSTQGTWVGAHEATIENIVALQSGKAVRVRIAFRRPEEERWNLDRILKIQATFVSPNPSTPNEPMIVLKPEIEATAKSGKDIVEIPLHNKSMNKRIFKLTR